MMIQMLLIMLSYVMDNIFSSNINNSQEVIITTNTKKGRGYNNMSGGFGNGAGFGDHGFKSSNTSSDVEANAGFGGNFNSNNGNSNSGGNSTNSVAEKKNASDTWNLTLTKAAWNNIPFFGNGNNFYGRNAWDWINKSKHNFCDSIDRLNCSFTPAMLLFFTVLISAKLIGFNDNPMECLKSKELDNEEFAHSLEICQTKNVYSVPSDEGIPWENQERKKKEIGYYHWVPITLILQAIFFFLPNWLWTHLSRNTKVDYTALIQDAYEANIDKENEDATQFGKLTKTIYHSVMDNLASSQQIGGKLYITLLYFFIKFLYLVNAVGQFLFLNALLGRSYSLWGYNVLMALMNGEKWQDSPIFPRQALCDVDLRRLGSVVRYTLQCHLRINTYNEKIYLFIWFYVVLLACATLVNLIYYFSIFLPSWRQRTVWNLLAGDKNYEVMRLSIDGMNYLKDFAENSLGYDGVLLCWFIKGHLGLNAARKMLAKLLEMYNMNKNVDMDNLLKIAATNDGTTPSKPKQPLLAENAQDLKHHKTFPSAPSSGSESPPPSFHTLIDFGSSSSSSNEDLSGQSSNEDVSGHSVSSQDNHHLGFVGRSKDFIVFMAKDSMKKIKRSFRLGKQQSSSKKCAA